MKSNAEYWSQLQEEGYFENHPDYKGLNVFGGEECIEAIEHFTSFRPEMKLVVIGCGYGRETLKLAPLVGHVYGIDVNDTILNKARGFLEERGVKNFTPVRYDRYGGDIPEGVDLVFSIVVMQHLARDMVRDYFRTLGQKLAPDGAFVVQFIDWLSGDEHQEDAEMRAYEPSVGWTPAQLEELCEGAGLKLSGIRTIKVLDNAMWHWIYATRA